MPSFDLLTEPWIPAADRNGRVREYGLLEVLEQAHDLACLVDAAPPHECGLYRLLIAFVLDAYEIREFDDIKDRLQAAEPERRFDRATLEGYVEKVGRRRFDLFDPAWPFLQCGPMEGDETKGGSVAKLFFHFPSGTNVTHFHHRAEHEHAVSPAVCARALCAIAPFMTAGGAGYSPSINGTPPLYVLVRGDSLYETILLNCYGTRDLELDGDDPPAWRANRPFEPKAEAACTSLVQGLTWQARQVRLIPGEGGLCTYTGAASPILVRRAVFGPGLKFTSIESWRDPQTAYKESEKGRFPLRPQEDREIWRDTGPLLLLRKADFEGERSRVRYDRPRVVDQFRDLVRYGALARGRLDRMEVDVYGVRADKAKVFTWQMERLALPLSVADNPTAGAQVQRAMETADSVAYVLGKALKRAYPRDASGNEKGLDRLIQVAEAQLWSDLQQQFVEQFLPALADQDQTNLNAAGELAQTWHQVLRQVGQRVLESVLDGLDADAKALARQVEARGLFAGLLKAILEPAAAQPKRERRTAKA